jgi:hypothetical protein
LREISKLAPKVLDHLPSRREVKGYDSRLLRRSLETLQRIRRNFRGFRVKRLRLREIPGASGAGGEFDTMNGAISLSPQYFSAGAAAKAKRKDLRDRRNDSVVHSMGNARDIIAHESGHAIDAAIYRNMRWHWPLSLFSGIRRRVNRDDVSRLIMAEAVQRARRDQTFDENFLFWARHSVRSDGFDMSDMVKRHLKSAMTDPSRIHEMGYTSRYGSANIHETIAEAFSDYYRTKRLTELDPAEKDQRAAKHTAADTRQDSDEMNPLSAAIVAVMHDMFTGTKEKSARKYRREILQKHKDWINHGPLNSLW